MDGPPLLRAGTENGLGQISGGPWKRQPSSAGFSFVLMRFTAESRFASFRPRRLSFISSAE